jgi:hypothetical protein
MCLSSIGVKAKCLGGVNYAFYFLVVRTAVVAAKSTQSLGHFHARIAALSQRRRFGGIYELEIVDSFDRGRSHWWGC